MAACAPHMLMTNAKDMMSKGLPPTMKSLPDAAAAAEAAAAAMEGTVGLVEEGQLLAHHGAAVEGRHARSQASACMCMCVQEVAGRISGAQRRIYCQLGGRPPHPLASLTW